MAPESSASGDSRIENLKNSLIVIFSPYLPRLVVIDLRQSEESGAIIRGLDVRDIVPADLCQDISSVAGNGGGDLVSLTARVLTSVVKFLNGERPELSRVLHFETYVHPDPESFFSSGEEEGIDLRALIAERSDIKILNEEIARILREEKKRMIRGGDDFRTLWERKKE